MNENQSGLTLVEVMVAIAVLSIGVLGIAQLQLTTVRTNGESRIREESIRILATSIEEVGFEPYSSFESKLGTGPLTPGELMRWKKNPGYPTDDGEQAGNIRINETRRDKLTVNHIVEEGTNGALIVHYCVYWFRRNELQTVFGDAVKSPDREG